MHFTVLVIGENPEDQISPFDVNEPETDYYTKEEIIELSRNYYFNYDTTASDDNVWREYLDHWDNPSTDKNGLYPFYDQEKVGFWDWYEIGGRWSGLLKLKYGRIPLILPHADYTETEEDLFARIADNRCDSAYIEDIENLDEVAKCTHSILMDGEYFDDVSNAKDILIGLEKGTQVTVIDCHI